MNLTKLALILYGLLILDYIVMSLHIFSNMFAGRKQTKSALPIAVFLTVLSAVTLGIYFEKICSQNAIFWRFCLETVSVVGMILIVSMLMAIAKRNKDDMASTDKTDTTNNIICNSSDETDETNNIISLEEARKRRRKF